MKKVIIIGATGSLAQYVIGALRELDNVKLTLFMRNRAKLSRGLSQGCSVIEGNAANYSDVRDAIRGQDIVYINLSGNLEQMGANIVKAMKETGVGRVIAISSIGIYEIPLKPVLVPYRKLADIIEASGLDYTILRPDWFTSSTEVDYMLTRKGEPETGCAISRKSIAAFIATLIVNPSLHTRENLGISRPN